ncbi:MAG: hypothetical protein IT323_00290 [Anaerolineae bacterium]|nr:hypothetical protein [Anaerolineae bacterium]
MLALLVSLYAGAALTARGQDDSEFRTAIVLTDHAYPGPVTATPIKWDGYPMETATQIPTDTPEPTATPSPTATPTATPSPTPTPPPHTLYIAVLLKGH